MQAADVDRSAAGMRRGGGRRNWEGWVKAGDAAGGVCSQAKPVWIELEGIAQWWQILRRSRS